MAFILYSICPLYHDIEDVIAVHLTFNLNALTSVSEEDSQCKDI